MQAPAEDQSGAAVGGRDLMGIESQRPVDQATGARQVPLHCRRSRGVQELLGSGPHESLPRGRRTGFLLFSRVALSCFRRAAIQRCRRSGPEESPERP